MNHFLLFSEQFHDLRSGAVADTQPDEFRRLSDYNASRVKVAVLRYDSEIILCRPLRDGAVIRSE
jgi:hypothetical protein